MRKLSSKIIAIAAALLMAACAPELKREIRPEARFVWGWTGTDGQTTDPLDPYIERQIIVPCPSPLDKLICKAYVSGNQMDAIGIVVLYATIREKDLGAHLRLLMDNSKNGCNGNVEEDVLVVYTLSYPYARSECYNNGTNYRTILINRWGKTYMFSMHRTDGAPVSLDWLLRAVKDTRFPA
jgi:hypothetical protein